MIVCPVCKTEEYCIFVFAVHSKLEKNPLDFSHLYWCPAGHLFKRENGQSIFVGQVS